MDDADSSPKGTLEDSQQVIKVVHWIVPQQTEQLVLEAYRKLQARYKRIAQPIPPTNSRGDQSSN